jgi:hypothetical protein
MSLLVNNRLRPVTIFTSKLSVERVSFTYYADCSGAVQGLATPVDAANRTRPRPDPARVEE